MSRTTAAKAKRIVLPLSGIVLLAGAFFWACSSSDDTSLLPVATGTTTGTGGTAGAVPTGGEGGFDPNPNPCQGHAGDTICEQGVAITCGPNEEQLSEVDCGDEVCVPDVGCQLCIDGQYSCYGNQVQQCITTPSLQWEAVGTPCNPLSSERCNPTLGVCEPLVPIGNGPGEPTGTYYQYARFLTGGTAFLGGYDVDSLGNYLYVNRSGSHLDVYMVELLDSDGDQEFEPNQHPDNPDDIGPIETRVLTHIATYDTALGDASGAELYATPDRVFFVNRGPNLGQIHEYVFATGVTTTPIDSPTGLRLAQMGYDPINDIWYGSSEQARRVFSYHQPTNDWVAEFMYPNLAGDHMDGLEIVVDPNSGTPYVYVSDMTSDYLGQYVRERGGTWKQVNLFEYQGTGEHVEGMGFGALNHFWATAGDALYEIGGGDLQKFTEPEPPPR